MFTIPKHLTNCKPSSASFRVFLKAIIEYVTILGVIFIVCSISNDMVAYGTSDIVKLFLCLGGLICWRFVDDHSVLCRLRWPVFGPVAMATTTANIDTTLPIVVPLIFVLMLVFIVFYQHQCMVFRPNRVILHPLWLLRSLPGAFLRAIWGILEPVFQLLPPLQQALAACWSLLVWQCQPLAPVPFAWHIPKIIRPHTPELIPIQPQAPTA
ncbi:MAG: hypothetical protein HC914_22205 [Chloroflexaceae bacterium]|nr:hypothetical protein [Chloroflexaceae bacterium]